MKKPTLKQWCLAAFVLGLAAAAAATWAPAAHPMTVRPTPAGRWGRPLFVPVYGSQLLARLNQARAARRLPPLTWDTRLAQAAAGHTLAMARGGFYAHVGLDGTPLARMKAAHFPGRGIWGENVAAWYASPQTTGDALLADPSNRDLIMRPFSHVGIAAAYAPGSRWGWYWTLDYGLRG